jgi:hypothetical protein
MRHFDCDVPTSDNDHARRQGLQTHHRIRRFERNARVHDDLRDGGATACGDDDLVRRDPRPVVDDQFMRTDEAGVPTVDSDVVRRSPRPASSPRGLLYTTEDPVFDGSPIGSLESGREVKMRSPLDQHRQVSCVTKHLRRNAAPVDAGPPEGIALDERDLAPANVVGDRHVARTRTNDGERHVSHRGSLQVGEVWQTGV